MAEEHTTAAVQHYLNALAGDQPAEPIIRASFDRSVRLLAAARAETSCIRKYRRLTLPPLNLQTDEMVSAVVGTPCPKPCVRFVPRPCQFFASGNQHIVGSSPTWPAA